MNSSIHFRTLSILFLFFFVASLMTISPSELLAQNPNSGTTSSGQTLTVEITSPKDGAQFEGLDVCEVNVSGKVSIDTLGAVLNVLYVLDLSGSTADPTNIAPLDLNGDGVVDADDDFNDDEQSGQIIDAEIQAAIELNKFFGDFENIEIGVIGYASNAAIADVSPLADVTNFISPPLRDDGSGGDEIPNGIADIEEVLRSMRPDPIPGSGASIGEFTEIGPDELGSATNYKAALQTILDAFSGQPGNESKIAYFLSDGSNTGEAFNAELSALAEAGIIVHAIGMTEESDPSALQEIANATGGVFLQIDNPGDLAEALPDIAVFVGIAGVNVNEQEVVLNQDGTFTTTLTIPVGVQTIAATATAEDETAVTATISVECVEPGTPENCVTFETQDIGKEFGACAENQPGDIIFTESNISVAVDSFQFSGGGGTFGCARIDAISLLQGGESITLGAKSLLALDGNFTSIGNINLCFDFTKSCFSATKITFEFADFGGEENISVNGEAIFAGELTDAPADIATGVTLTVEKDETTNIGKVTLEGLITSLCVGGQEFVLDNVCIEESVAKVLACTLDITSPQDGDVVRSSSVLLAVDGELTGAVEPITTICTLNGVVIDETQPIIANLTPGENKLVLECTVEDSCGNVAVCSDSVTVTFEPLENCVTFDALETGTEFGDSAGNLAGDVIFTESNISVSVDSFQFSGGGAFFGTAHVEDQSTLPGFGVGKFVFISNLNLCFDFTKSCFNATKVSFEFQDSGGEENISVNGETVFTGELTDAPADIATGVTLTVDVDPVTNTGKATLQGSIASFCVGGQEFSLDNVCIEDSVPKVLACTLDITSPQDGDVVRSSSVLLAVDGELTGAVEPITTICTLNGVVIDETQPIIANLTPGENKLVLECTVEDSCGNVAVCSDSVTVTFEPLENCVTFDALETGTEFGDSAGNLAGDVIFTESNISVSVDSFQFSGGGAFFGTAHVEDQSTLPGFGVGKFVFISNLNLCFDFTKSCFNATKVSFEFQDSGGEENISVNGETVFTGELTDAPADIATGVTLTVDVDPVTNTGKATLQGSIASFCVGGQEFSLDNVCIEDSVPKVLACTLDITSPQDGDVVCADSVIIKFNRDFSGGVEPVSVICELNGSIIPESTEQIVARLNSGENLIVLKCTIEDSCGNVAMCSDSVAVFFDDIPPGCEFKVVNGAVKGTFFDEHSGIGQIVPIKLKNTELNIDFEPGAKEVSFSLERIDPDKPLRFSIDVYDLCGNKFNCDPVFIDLSTERSDRQIEFTFPEADRYFQLSNQGLTEVRVDLNGNKFTLTTDAAKANKELNTFLMPHEGVITIDLADYLHGGDNRIHVAYEGPHGAHADLFLLDIIDYEPEFILRLDVLPEEFQLVQNYPNPFNPTTKIQFDIPASHADGVKVQLKIYNLLGELVRTLVDEQKGAGRYVVEWNAQNDKGEPVSTGIYIYRLTAGDFHKTNRMVFLK
ncbi:MAG: FlgD immunoglobulin-like domain containing protein [bacterium]